MIKEISPSDQEQGVSYYNMNSWRYITNPAFDPCEEESPSAGWQQVYVCMGGASWQ
jgi:hypothetical protein